MAFVVSVNLSFGEDLTSYILSEQNDHVTRVIKKRNAEWPAWKLKAFLCLKRKLWKRISEIVTFGNLKAPVCCLDLPQDQCRDKISQQPAHIRNRRLLIEIKRVPQHVFFFQTFSKVKELHETFSIEKIKLENVNLAFFPPGNVVLGIANTSNFGLRNHFWMAFFSLWRAFMEDNCFHSVFEMWLIVDDFDGCCFWKWWNSEGT